MARQWLVIRGRTDSEAVLTVIMQLPGTEYRLEDAFFNADVESDILTDILMMDRQIGRQTNIFLWS